MLFPEKTKLNKIMPKAKFMKFANLSPVAKNELQSNVERLILSNILRMDTINIEKGKDVSEINVFEFLLKDKKMSDNLIKEIDSNVPKHIVFILKNQTEAQLVITYKEKSQNSDKYKVLKIYRSEWQNLEDIKLNISGLNLDTVFNNLISQIACGKIEVRQDETLKDVVEKSIDIEKLERKISQMENKIKKETQFNKQLDLKKELKELQTQLEGIYNG